MTEWRLHTVHNGIKTNFATYSLFLISSNWNKIKNKSYQCNYITPNGEKGKLSYVFSLISVFQPTFPALRLVFALNQPRRASRWYVITYISPRSPPIPLASQHTLYIIPFSCKNS